MSRLRLRSAVISAVALVAVAATTLITADAAQAAGPVTGGTTTAAVPVNTAIAQLHAGIYTATGAGASTGFDKTNLTFTFSFPVTGGTARVDVRTGHLDLAGSITYVNVTGFPFKKADLGTLVFDLFRAQITAVPNGSTTPVVLFDTAGTRTVGRTGDTQTFTSTQLLVDPAGAAYLDSTLGTSFFTAGQNLGSYAASWTTATS